MRNQLKIRVTVLMLFFIQLIQAQVGINEPNPKLDLDVRASSNSNTVFTGMRAPRTTGDELNSKTYTADHDGAIVFVTTPASIPNQVGQTIDVKYKGYYYFDIVAIPGGKWVRWTTQGNVLALKNISVSAVSIDGNYNAGQTLDSSHKVSFRVTNNSFQPIANIDFSNDVSVENGGAVISVDGSANNNVSLASGASQVLTYQLSGVPQVGALKAKFDKSESNLYAEISTTVNYINPSPNLDYAKYYVSYKDGSKEYQGKFNNDSNTHQTSFWMPVSYSSSSPCHSPAGVSPIERTVRNFTETSAPGENGDVNDITLSVQHNTCYRVAYCSINIGGDGEYLIKKLAPGQSYTIATFNIDFQGTVNTIKLVAIGGIPDRRYGDNSGHDFIYRPTIFKGYTFDPDVPNSTIPYNKKWLTFNLGAGMTDTNSTDFSPNVETSDVARTGKKFEGSSFQWQRPADGHEFKYDSNESSQTTTTTVIPNTWSPGHDKIIKVNGFWNTVGNSNTGLWKAGGANNPCPVGYHVPTIKEIQDFYVYVGGSKDPLPREWFFADHYTSNMSNPGYQVDIYSTTPPPASPLPNTSVFWWSSTPGPQANNPTALTFQIFYNINAYLGLESTQSNLGAIRCVED